MDERQPPQPDKQGNAELGRGIPAARPADVGVGAVQDEREAFEKWYAGSAFESPAENADSGVFKRIAGAAWFARALISGGTSR